MLVTNKYIIRVNNDVELTVKTCFHPSMCTLKSAGKYKYFKAWSLVQTTSCDLRYFFAAIKQEVTSKQHFIISCLVNFFLFFFQSQYFFFQFPFLVTEFKRQTKQKFDFHHLAEAATRHNENSEAETVSPEKTKDACIISHAWRYILETSRYLF